MTDDKYQKAHSQEVAENDSEIISLKKEYYELKKINSTLLLCINTLYDSNDSEDAINYLLATIAGYHNAKRACIFEISSDNKNFINTFVWEAEDFYSKAPCMKTFPTKSLSRWLSIFEKDGSVIINSTQDLAEKDSNEFEILSMQNIDSLMAVPLYKHGKLTGMITIGNPKANMESATLLKSVATFLVGDLERRKYMDQLYNLSYHDKMTGLQNRHAYIKKMAELEKTEAKNENKARNKKLGIIFADINGLKAANDNYGHEKGDEMIITTSTILKTICATAMKSTKNMDSETFQKHLKKTNIYRIGGDEFVVFFEDIQKKVFEEKVEEMKKHPIISVGSVYLEKCENIEKHVGRSRQAHVRRKEKVAWGKGIMENG